MLKLLLAISLVVISGRGDAAPISLEPDRVIYQVYTRAFYDGSGVPDMEGDFAGIVAKIPYLKTLGVDTLLLMPIFSSTGDMGYIPRDYFRVDEAYGSVESFRSFADTMHEKGFKIILDAPVNHISYDSPWFYRGVQKKCLASDPSHNADDPDNEFCDYFYFVDDPCRTHPYDKWHKPWRYHDTDCTAVFFQRPEYDPAYHRPQFTYATFFSVMPDLKFWDFEEHRWNTPVVNKIKEFFRFWSANGADGFRIDAAKHFVEGYDTNGNPLEPRNMELLESFLAAAREVNPDVSFLGEIWAPHHEFEPYLSGALDMVLDFPFMEAVRDSVRDLHGDRFKNVLLHLERTQEDINPGQRVVFAGNHDVSRMMTEWNDDEQRLRLAHFISLTNVHSPLIYYAEEIGAHGKVKRPDHVSDEEYVRTIKAFPWHGRDETVGFPGSGSPVVGLPENWEERNLEDLENDAESSFHLVRQLLEQRKSWGLTKDARLKVRQDLYGHVIGWTVIQPVADRYQCRTVIVNFNGSSSYDVPSHHGDTRCDAVSAVEFSENAELTANGSQARMGAFGKIILR